MWRSCRRDEEECEAGEATCMGPAAAPPPRPGRRSCGVLQMSVGSGAVVTGVGGTEGGVREGENGGVDCASRKNCGTERFGVDVARRNDERSATTDEAKRGVTDDRTKCSF